MMKHHRSSLLAILLAVQPLLAAPPSSLEPVSGSLVIVGGGKLPDSIREEFFNKAGGKDKAKIVVIPTASADADDPTKPELFLKAWRDLGPKNVQLLHTRDPKKADADFAKPLAEATGIWFSGGDQNKLIATYHGTPAEKAFRDVLARGGVLGGTSAGAAIMSDLMIEGGTKEAKIGPGFGFLSGIVVDQHFTQRKRIARLRGVIKNNPEYAGIGIDESTAIVISGRRITVIGEGTVTAIWAASDSKPAREDVLKPKAQLDLFQVRRAASFRAAKEQFPTKVAAVPVVPKGSLVIVGGGGVTQEIMDRFFQLAGGKEALIVVIPTASETETVPEDPSDAKFLRKWGANNVKVLHTRDRKKADDPEFSKVLLEAKGVWFGGGRQWRFVDSYEGTLTAKRFHEVLARGGVIGGSSAGASIQSEYMPRGHPLGNTVMAAEGYERGFGYLPGVAVDQHFFARKRTADMTGLMKQYPQLLGIGLDEATAIIVQGSIAEVVGKTKVAFYDYRNGPPKGEIDYTEVPSGGKYNLKERKPIK